MLKLAGVEFLDAPRNRVKLRAIVVDQIIKIERIVLPSPIGIERRDQFNVRLVDRVVNLLLGFCIGDVRNAVHAQTGCENGQALAELTCVAPFEKFGERRESLGAEIFGLHISWLVHDRIGVECVRGRSFSRGQERCRQRCAPCALALPGQAV